MPTLPAGFLFYDGAKWVLDDGEGTMPDPSGFVNITSSYTTSITDKIISVGSITSSITVNLISSPLLGTTHIIKDANGSASSFPITVNGNGITIDGYTSISISSNYNKLTVCYNGSKWIII